MGERQVGGIVDRCFVSAASMIGCTALSDEYAPPAPAILRARGLKVVMRRRRLQRAGRDGVWLCGSGTAEWIPTTWMRVVLSRLPLALGRDLIASAGTFFFRAAGEASETRRLTTLITLLACTKDLAAEFNPRGIVWREPRGLI